MSSRICVLAGLLLAVASGVWAWSCGSGDKPVDEPPSDAGSEPSTTAPDPCEQGWLPSDIKQATYTLRGGPDDDELGYWLGEGDLDGDGLVPRPLSQQADGRLFLTRRSRTSP